MAWYVYVAHFFAGIFLANCVPHFVQGISGRKFQSPFASPPGVGESSATVNVVWGFVNFVVAFLLLAGFGPFKFEISLDALAVGLVMIVISIILAGHFSHLHDK